MMSGKTDSAAANAAESNSAAVPPYVELVIVPLVSLKTVSAGSGTKNILCAPEETSSRNAL
jgi:hypothetical protein